MSNVIDFTHGTDTGEADAEAIAPIQNGEDMDQATLRRATENVRFRTEALRAEVNENRWVRDADRAADIFFGGAASVTWGDTEANAGTGELVMSQGEMYITPMYGPGVTRGDSNEGAGALYPTRYARAAFDDGNGDDFVLLTSLTQSEGGDQITFTTVTEVGHVGITVEVHGDATVIDPATRPGARNIVITYDPASSYTWSHILEQLAADAQTSAMLQTSTYAPYPAGELVTDVSVALAGAYDSVMHVITQAQLAAFFAADPVNNRLKEGDVLAIWYDTAALRRASIEELGFSAIPAASLANLTAEPGKAANAVVIGRVSGDNFVTSNGFAMSAGFDHVSRPKTEAGAVRTDPSAWAAVTGLSAQTALDSVDATLVANAAVAANATDLVRADVQRGNAAPPAAGTGNGADHVGVDTTAFVTLPSTSDSLQEFMDDAEGEFTSIASSFTDVDTEFGLLYGTGGVHGPGDVGAVRIDSNSANFPEIQPTSDDLASTIEAMYARLQSHESMQDLIEASHMTRTGPTLNTKSFPQFLDADVREPGSLDGFYVAGNWSGAVTSTLYTTSADGRFIILPASADTVRVLNARDRSAAALIVLQSAVTSEMTAFASDGFSLAIAYDSKIELYNLDTMALDATWATGGTYTHSSNVAHAIHSMVFQNRELYFGAAAADGVADSTVGSTLVVLSYIGVIRTEGTVSTGDVVSVDVWGPYVAFHADNVGVAFVAAGVWDTKWEDAYAAWSSVQSVKINQQGVAVSGAKATPSDPTVELRSTVEGNVIAEDIAFTTAVHESVSLAKSHDMFYVVASSAANGLARVKAYRGVGAATELLVVWEFDVTVTLGTQFYSGISTDGVRLFLMRYDAAANDEQLREYHMGAGAGSWVVTQRGIAPTGDLIPLPAYPLSSMRL